jgi:cyclic pyranopterin phosphate synthase
MDDVITAREIVETIGREMPLEPATPTYRGEVAKRWRYADGSGEIGVISSVTRAFCHSCTRARISTDGKLYTCLFATRGHDLRALLRGGCTDEQLATVMAHIWRARDDRYSELRGAATKALPVLDGKKIEMSYIGG